MRCPVCKTIELRKALAKQGVEVDSCPVCEGIWLDKNEIFYFTKAPTYVQMSMDFELRKEHTSSLSSPVDGQPMLRCLLPGKLTLDCCRTSGGIWFSRGEIRKIPALKEDIGIDRVITSYEVPPRPSPKQLLPLPNLTFHSSMAVFLLYFILGLFLIVLVEVAHVPAFMAVIIAVVIACVQFLFAPFFMDLSLKYFYGVLWMQKHELPVHLVEFVEKTCQRHSIAFPRIGTIRDGAPNAFTYGHHPNNARIVLTEGTMGLLEPQELEAVVAHEIGHIVHWDMLIMTVIQIVPLILYYVYRSFFGMKSKGKDKSAPYRFLVAIVSYILYLVSEYAVLWFSRIREFYADRFSADAIGDPSLLAQALVKIGYGLAGQSTEATKNKYRSEELAAVGPLGIFDKRAAQAFAIAGFSASNTIGSGINKENIKAAAKWDLWNPWAKYFEFHSTHPLIANRLRYLGNQSLIQGKEPYITFDERQPESYWDEFFVDVLFKVAPFIALLIAALVFVIQSITLTSLGLFFLLLGVGYGAQVYFSYAGALFPEMTVASLLKNVKVSGIRPVPCTLKGTIIGRGVPGYIFSEDFVVQDATGILFLDYQQPLPIWVFLFGLLKAKHYINQQAEIIGWYRRAPVPYIEIKQIKVGITGISRCYVFQAKVVTAILLAACGITLMLYNASIF